jgi:hypothetical protein
LDPLGVGRSLLAHRRGLGAQREGLLPGRVGLGRGLIPHRGGIRGCLRLDPLGLGAHLLAGRLGLGCSLITHPGGVGGGPGPDLLGLGLGLRAEREGLPTGRLDLGRSLLSDRDGIGGRLHADPLGLGEQREGVLTGRLGLGRSLLSRRGGIGGGLGPDLLGLRAEREGLLTGRLGLGPSLLAHGGGIGGRVGPDLLGVALGLSSQRSGSSGGGGGGLVDERGRLGRCRAAKRRRLLSCRPDHVLGVGHPDLVLRLRCCGQPCGHCSNLFEQCGRLGFGLGPYPLAVLGGSNSEVLGVAPGLGKEVFCRVTKLCRLGPGLLRLLGVPASLIGQAQVLVLGLDPELPRLLVEAGPRLLHLCRCVGAGNLAQMRDLGRGRIVHRGGGGLGCGANPVALCGGLGSECRRIPLEACGLVEGSCGIRLRVRTSGRGVLQERLGLFGGPPAVRDGCGARVLGFPSHCRRLDRGPLDELGGQLLGPLAQCGRRGPRPGEYVVGVQLRLVPDPLRRGRDAARRSDRFGDQGAVSDGGGGDVARCVHASGPFGSGRRVRPSHLSAGGDLAHRRTWHRRAAESGGRGASGPAPPCTATSVGGVRRLSAPASRASLY